MIDNTNAELRRALRGGSFYYFRRNVRCASRFDDVPDFRFDYSSFRVVVSGVDREPIRRVLQGGSSHNTLRNIRTAFRLRFLPHNRYDNFGYRVVASEDESE